MKGTAGLFFTGTVMAGTFLLGLSGCGYKTRPVPPATVVPAAIEDLRYTMGQDRVKLRWSFPDRNIQGDELRELSGFKLFMAEIPLADYCPSCPIPFHKPIEVPGGLTVVDGKRRVATYDYDLLREGQKYFFKVRSQRGWWAESGDSNIVTFVWNVPAAQPVGLTGSGADSSVRLRWQPVTSRRDGEPLTTELLYRVLRQSGDRDFRPVGELVKKSALEDRDVVNGRRYSYQVQAVLRFGEDLVYGEPSEPLTLTPVDTTPPLPPTDVQVFRTGQGIRLFWESSDSRDVAGYFIYRRSVEGNMTRVGSVAAPDTSFVDTGTVEGTSYRYAVSAYDHATPANESKRSPEAAPRY